jgi:hypothetical protein
MKKLSIIILLLIILLGFIGYYYVMHGGGRDLSSEAVSYTVASKDIVTEFSNNIDAANKKYLEKAVAIHGVVTSAKSTEIIIDNTIICKLKEPIKTIKKNQILTVKGRVVGYDDLMSEIQLDQCIPF